MMGVATKASGSPFALGVDDLARHWVAAAGFMGGALLLVVPLLIGMWPWPLLLIFLHSPVYMIHQVEEHADDRFRTFVNRTRFGGREALTTSDVIRINVGFVWGIDLAALYVAWLCGAGWALAAPYLMLVNALAHIGPAIRFRGYNPGLVTGIVLFIPLSAVTLALTPATLMQHGIGLAVSVLLHVAIAISAYRRAKASPAV